MDDAASASAIEWDDDTFKAKLNRVRTEGTIDADGAWITSERLGRIVEAARQHAPHAGVPLLKEASFERATFEGDARFGDVIFDGPARFDGATFEGGAWFGEAIFPGEVGYGPGSPKFHGPTFKGLAGFGGATFKSDARFGGATFESSAVFNKAIFEGHVGFRGVTFDGSVEFDGATFERRSDFDQATFQGPVSFVTTFKAPVSYVGSIFGDVAWFAATFEGYAGFGVANFKGKTVFDGGTFKDAVSFDSATFEQGAGFGKATFGGKAGFSRAAFGGDADFSNAIFQNGLDFSGVTVDGDAQFREGSLQEAFVLGPMLVRRTLVLDGASFNGIEIRASADRLTCNRTQFHGPSDLRIRWAEVTLDGVAFESASLVTSLEGFDALAEHTDRSLERLDELSDLERGWRKDSESPSNETPRLISLRGSDVGNLVLADVNLAACLFARAANLEGLRIGGSRTFPRTPGWVKDRRFGIPVWRWSGRRTIAEEHEWRTRQKRPHGWQPPHCRPPKWLLGSPMRPRALEPDEIAEIYRALRKGREDNKDEPGAADFYFGEMEMRRAAKPAWAERALLWLYWLVSGYGLRGSRALAALVITIALGAVLLGLSGFDAGKHPDEGTLLFAAESSISLLRAPDTQDLTAAGRVIEIVLRLAGPLLFGLALLSLRGRVKR